MVHSQDVSTSRVSASVFADLVSLALLIQLTTLGSIRTLRVAISIHLAPPVLLCAVNGLWLLRRITWRSLRRGGSITNGRQLSTAHGGRHHMWGWVLSRRSLSWSTVLLSTTGSLLALSLLVGLASIVFLLLLCFPLFAYFFEFCDEEERRVLA